jgi:NTP pyrophosphatase (non-canonical NTP hydrolase)
MLENLRIANQKRQLEWDGDNQLSLTYQGNELAGECGEACNVIKKLERERLGLRGSRATLQDLADELADVVIVADLIAARMGINLAQAVIDKFNATSAKYGLETRMISPSEWAERRPLTDAESAANLEMMRRWNAL